METSEPTLTGRSIIGLRTPHPQPSGRRFHAVNPATGHEIKPPFEAASEAELVAAVERAVAAFPTYAKLQGPRRAAFLRASPTAWKGSATRSCDGAARRPPSPSPGFVASSVERRVSSGCSRT